MAEVRDAYREHLDRHVRGIYVRGTVARGTAIDGVSDLGDFALVDSGGLDLSWRDGVSERLMARHPHVTGVGLDVVTTDDIGSMDRFSELALQMVTQTACVWGEDIIPRLPKYRPGVLVANNDVSSLKK